MKQDFQSFALGPSAGVSLAGREVFPVFPQFAVGVVRKGKVIPDVSNVAGPEQLQDLLFQAVSPTAK